MNGLLSNVNIGPKIYGLVALLLAATIAVASTGIFQMGKVGKELHAVASQDLPLTKELSTITTRQLEQASLFERAIAIGGRIAKLPATPGDLATAEEAFAASGKRVTAALHKGMDMLANTLTLAKSDAERREVKILMARLKAIQQEHDEYEKRAVATMGRVEHGDFHTLKQQSAFLEAQGNKMDHELEAALRGVEGFAEKATESVDAYEQSALSQISVIALVSLAFGVVIGTVIVRGTAGPIRSMTAAMNELAQGNLDVVIPAQGRKDEVGLMAASMQVFKEQSQRVKRMEAERAEAEQRAEAERKKMLLDLADNFEASIKHVVSTVSSSATELTGAAQSMSTIASETSSQASTVAAASEEASTNVQTVAAASEELAASIDEISRQVTQSTTIATSAVREAETVNSQVRGLAEAASRVGEVVSLISDIAEQTNLLALNATIEAARAGEAGKGFAVVAGEVKNLANQTARATEDISSQIGAIQDATQGAVDGIGGIAATIGRMNEIASSIAAAVEEQGAATGEIARNVEEASRGTQNVSENILKVDVAAKETGSAAEEILSAAENLARNSETLASDVDRFVDFIRSS